MPWVHLMMSWLSCWAVIAQFLAKHFPEMLELKKRFGWEFPLLWYQSKASLGPYAWQYKKVKRLRSCQRLAEQSNPQSLPLEEASNFGRPDIGDPILSQPMMLFKDTYLDHADLATLPRSRDVFRGIESHPSLTLRLPKPRASAGLVLRHCAEVFQQVHDQNKPMTWKFGLTHDAVMRWTNPAFGYSCSNKKMDKFDYMIVLYAASQCHGPAFLEASLIQRFGSFLDADSTTSFSVSLKIPVNIWAGVASLFCLKSLGFALRLARLQKYFAWWRRTERCRYWTISDIYGLQVL